MKLTESEKFKLISALELQIANIHSIANEIMVRNPILHNQEYVKAMYESIKFNKDLIKKLSEK